MSCCNSPRAVHHATGDRPRVVAEMRQNPAGDELFLSVAMVVSAEGDTTTSTGVDSGGRSRRPGRSELAEAVGIFPEPPLRSAACLAVGFLLQFLQTLVGDLLLLAVDAHLLFALAEDALCGERPGVVAPAVEVLDAQAVGLVFAGLSPRFFVFFPSFPFRLFAPKVLPDIP